MQQREVQGFVDGPHPDRADLEDGESMVILVTSIAIAFGVLGIFCSSGLTAFMLWRWRAAGVKSSTPAAAPSQPTVLTSQPDTKKEEVSV